MRASAPTLKLWLLRIQERLPVRLYVVPTRMAFVVPLEPVTENPAGRKLAMPEVSSWPAMLPFGIPSSLFFRMPKSSAYW